MPIVSGVKEMIKSRTACMEAAALILEAGRSIDDLIILGESAEPAEPAEENDPTSTELEGEDGGGLKPEGEKEGSTDPVPPANGGGAEEPLPLPGNDDLPEPVGAQTGETPISADDDLLNVELNLGSNTLRDVLPVPPGNAGDAVGGDDDDLLNTRVDTGFGGDEGSAEATPAEDGGGLKPEGEKEGSTDPVPPAEGEDDDLLHEELGDGKPVTEAITMGDEPAPAAAAAPAPAAEPAAEATPADPGTDQQPAAAAPVATDGTDATGTEEDNPVTSAVKDKVAEMEEPTPGTTMTPEDMFKKLSNMSKGIEDLKRAVFAQQQTGGEV